MLVNGYNSQPRWSVIPILNRAIGRDAANVTMEGVVYVEPSQKTRLPQSENLFH